MRLFRSRLAAAILFCLSVVFMGTMGYVAIEEYTLFEGLYMSVITISTVGFGEVRPLSIHGQALTTILILLGFISLAFAGHTLGQSLVERVWSGQVERKKMQKKIRSLKKHYILCGFGRVGAAAAAYFEESNVDFVVIEANEANQSVLQEQGYCYLIGDATHEDTLVSAGIKKASGLMALLDDDPDNLFLVLSARELNPTLHIISRVDESSSSPKIKRAGADDVISPFASAGLRIAIDILNATGKAQQNTDSLQDSDTTAMQWITVVEGSDLTGRSLQQVARQMGCQVLGLRRLGNDRLMPDVDTVLQCEDQLLILDANGLNRRQAEGVAPNSKRLVLVDDNPVIRKLYMRLFQKAGFIPMTASNGQTGMEMILNERPDVAVIDYLLPLMSGIEVCRDIRKKMDKRTVKLILFTVDQRAETKQKALEAGADAVVVKSPDALEVIQKVCEIINA